MARWLGDNQYDSLDQLRDSMNFENCPNPSAYERANYMRLLQSWEP
jgi:dihydroorotate dehydrogenase (fumarate)